MVNNSLKPNWIPILVMFIVAGIVLGMFTINTNPVDATSLEADGPQRKQPSLSLTQPTNGGSSPGATRR